MANFPNPFRPGAGHPPPYLAGRQEERQEFLKLLDQTIIMENMVLTGLRGVGKTVLLESLKTEVTARGWLLVGTDLSESTSVSEETVAKRICTDLAPFTSNIVIPVELTRHVGFVPATKTIQHRLGYDELISFYNSTPGLVVDKLKAVLEFVWNCLSMQQGIRGIVFAYDEAQNLSDQSAKEQYPLSLLLDTFQSLQRKEFPLMLVLTGLPTLFPKLVEARTFAERMFRVVFLQSLNREESEQAILKPVESSECPVRLTEKSVNTIIDKSGGYPYFIQFICKEVYDAFIQRIDKGEEASVPVAEIEQKLNSDFFAGRWARATERQRDLLLVIAKLPSGEGEFTVQEVVAASKNSEKPFSSSHVNQMLVALSTQGLVFKNRYGKYSFAVPLLGRFILSECKVLGL